MEALARRAVRTPPPRRSWHSRVRSEHLNVEEAVVSRAIVVRANVHTKTRGPATSLKLNLHRDRASLEGRERNVWRRNVNRHTVARRGRDHVNDGRLRLLVHKVHCDGRTKR